MESKKLPDFRCFCESQFHLTYRASKVSDRRENADIPTSVVYNAVFLMGALGLGSLLLCDQTLRTPIGRKWFRRKSLDSTMARSLETMVLSKLRLILYDAYRLGLRQGVSKCSLRGGKLRIGILDGSSFGRFEASCFEVLGPISLILDLQQIPKRGKELPASYALLRRLKGVFGTEFVDIILGDGLYVNAPFVNLCLNEVKSDVLVKTNDTSLLIIKDAISIFSSDDLFKVAQVKGVDTQRMCQYQVTMTDGFQMQGIDAPLSVAWVREESLRNNAKQEEFFVVASNQYLTTPLNAEEMRELAHWRWDVENNGFKDLNQTVHTKHIYSHDDTAQQAVLLTLFVVFNLLGLYLFFNMAILIDFEGIKQTRKFAVFYLRYMLMMLAYFDAG